MEIEEPYRPLPPEVADAPGFRVTCTDDGRGGAVVGGGGGPGGAPGHGSGGGLAGIERRVGTFDGVMALRSPVGGPTVVTLEIPCASSSEKTSTS